MRVALQSAIKYSWRNGIAAFRTHSLLFAGTVVPFLVFFGPTILAGKFLVAGDPFYQSYPLRSVAWSEIARGNLPLWTPHIFSGYPLLSMAQLAIGYPLTWLYLVLPDHWAEEIVVLAPFILTPVFTYAYAREVGRSRTAAIIAALAFTYGGNMSSKLGGLSPAANSEMWLPLLLLVIERSRRRNFVSCLLAAAGAYAMSVLAGHAQGFMLVGTLALAYAVFVTAIRLPETVSGKRTLRWRPLAVATGGMILGAGVAAFQIFETLVAVRNSVRSTLSYEVFTAGAFSIKEAFNSFLAPPYHYIEVSTYVAPLAAILAVVAALKIRSATNDRSHIIFWLVVATLSFVLLLGDHTPLYRILYHVPVVNLFRYPSRHALEWTFALSILSAYGFDALRNITKQEKSQTHFIVACLALSISVVIAVLWWRSALMRDLPANFGLDSGLIPTLPEDQYLLWKLVFTACVALVVWQSFRIPAAAARHVLLFTALGLGLCLEAHIFLSHVWLPFAKSSSQFTTTPRVERWLQEQTPEEKRIYTRVNLFVNGYSSPPALDLPNMTAVRGLQNVAGYEQLILDRYSRALGNVGPDAVNPRYGMSGAPDKSLLTKNSHVLDLLNTHYIVGFSHFATAPEESIEKDGVRFRKAELGSTLLPGETLTLDVEAAAGDTLALITSLAASVDLAQGASVAAVRVVSVDGQEMRLELLAGRDTAEWAHERADVRPIIKHLLAPVFDEQPTEDKSFNALRFWSRLRLPMRLPVQRIEITNVTQGAQLAVWKATLYDSETRQSATAIKLSDSLPNDQVVPVFGENGVVVWQNKRTLPRAWLVTEAETVDSEEALRRIRGETDVPFDPARTALLETAASELPKPGGGNLPAESSCRITRYEPTRLTIETNSPTATVLVVSEIFYPGWEARVNGNSAPILATNYLLRGVVLPAGKHNVEMEYRAPAAKSGVYVSGLALLLIAGLFSYRRKQSRAV